MREKSVVGRIKPVARRESDAMEIDTEVLTVSKTSTVDLNTTALHRFIGGDGGLTGWTTDG